VTWKTMVYSATGTRHEQRGQPCQDYGSYRTEGPYLIGAVADGAGSAKHSEVGAQIAVESVLDAITVQLYGQALTFEAACEAALDIFSKAFEEVLSALNHEAEDAGCEINDLGCTLLAFVACSDWVAAMQIGDGLIVVRSSSSTEDSFRLLFEPDKGEFINETVFVTTARAEQNLRVCVHPSDRPFVCAATDGLERVAVRMQDWSPHAPFFSPFEACLRQLPTQPERELYLKTFLESERLNSKTDDDKTLLACLYDVKLPESS
jgi:Protein phosphatase 2C